MGLLVYLSVLDFFILAWELLFGSYVLWAPWCFGPSVILRLNLISLLPDSLQPPFIMPCLPLFYLELDRDMKLMSCCTRGSPWLRLKREELQNRFKYAVKMRRFVGGGLGSSVQIKGNLWPLVGLAGFA